MAIATPSVSTNTALGPSQDPTAKERERIQQEALRGWPAYVASFRRALRRKDRDTLRRLMAPDFWSWPAQMVGHDVAFETWNDPYQNGWRAFYGVLGRRSVWASTWFRGDGRPWRPMRVVPREANRFGIPGAPVVPWFAVFRYEADGKWYCTMFSGCCE